MPKEGAIINATSVPFRKTGANTTTTAPASNTRWTDARPILRALAISVAPSPLRFHFTHLGCIYRGRPPLVDTFGLGLGDALKLSLAA
jgi:hypothetical protein